MIQSRLFPALLLLASAACSAGVSTAPTPVSMPTAGAGQLVVVISPDWDSVRATLQRYEAGGANGSWVPVGGTIPVVVGKNGLGWGVGLHPEQTGPGPVKREGDSRAPAGVFALSGVFGYAPPDSAQWIHLPYFQATRDYECVDDPASKFYNRILYRSSLPKSGDGAPDWNSSEIMRRKDALYRWGVIVDHNANPPRSGSGSCIFIHLWSGPSSYTVGCTAGEEPQIKELLAWLDRARKPLLVQLPRGEYDRHRKDWSLP
jgi:L,D-peptidoglycan transpeptidase YkuD (ErfK/YbiS/YcfS/YnhG family)